MEIAEDSMASPDDGCAFALDQDAECVSVTGEDGIDDRSIVAAVDLGLVGGFDTEDGIAPIGSRPDPKEEIGRAHV